MPASSDNFPPIGGIIGKPNFSPIGGKFGSLAVGAGYGIWDSWRENAIRYPFAAMFSSLSQASGSSSATVMTSLTRLAIWSPFGVFSSRERQRISNNADGICSRAVTFPNGSRLPASESLGFELVITFLAPFDLLHDVVPHAIDHD